MKILFAGGGTLGPVTPLLAVHEEWKKQDKNVEAVWVGTKQGPERELIEKAGIRFFTIPVARLPRRISFELILLPTSLLVAFVKSFSILLFERPSLIASAGGYTAVPIIFAGWVLRIPSWIHQQDVKPLLTNRLTAPFAKKITVAWKKTLKSFPKEKTELVGNPVRGSVLGGNKEKARKEFGLNDSKPTVLVFGGGTGARRINDLFVEIGEDLEKVVNVIHITGKGKMLKKLLSIGKDYHPIELLTDNLADVYAVTDLIVCRSGMGTITEVSANKKPSIMIPIPRSDQEANAEVVKHGAVILKQGDIDAQSLYKTILLLLADGERQLKLSENIHELLKTDVSGKIVSILKTLVKKITH